MRRRTKAINVTLFVVGGFAVVVGDVPTHAPLEGPTLASQTSSITNSGVSVDGNVPPGFVESLELPSADRLQQGVSDGLSPRVDAGSNRVGDGADTAADDDGGAASEAEARREAAQREAAARREAAEAEDDARDEAADARADAEDEADDAEDDARDEADDANRDDFEPDPDDFEPDRP